MELNKSVTHEYRFRRVITASTKNWKKISFNDFGIKHSQDFIAAKKKANNIMEELVFTKVYDNFDGRIITEEHIVKNEEYIPVVAAWDTGSTYSCISPEFAKQLNLQSINVDDLHTPYGIKRSNIYEIDILINKQFIYGVQVMENPNIHEDNVGLLIGMDIISEGDFSISTYKDKTCFPLEFHQKV